MRIKPVLVPDHDAAALRGLMDRFAEATTGPTKRQLNESRAAVTAAQKTINEGFMDTVKQTFNDCVVGYPMGTSDEQFIQGWARAIQAETGRDIPLEKLTKLYQDYAERSDELMQSHGTTNESEHNHDHDDEEGETCPECDGAGCPECYGDEDRDRAYDRARGMERESADMAEGELTAYQKLLKQMRQNAKNDPNRIPRGYELTAHGELVKKHKTEKSNDGVGGLGEGMAEAGQPDVMRHKGDKTIKVVKRGGKPIGEIGIDAEASPGNGPYYVKLYDGSYDAVGFDTAEEALAELKYAISEGLAEGVDPVEQLRADIRRFAQ